MSNSNHDLYPFDQMPEEDFLEEIDDQNYGGGVQDVVGIGIDEYQMVFFFFFFFC